MKIDSFIGSFFVGFEMSQPHDELETHIGAHALDKVLGLIFSWKPYMSLRS